MDIVLLIVVIQLNVEILITVGHIYQNGYQLVIMVCA